MNTGIYQFSFIQNKYKQSSPNKLIKNINIISKKDNIPKPLYNKNIYNENRWFYICSYGGSGSTFIYNYLSQFGNVEHIHDRYPPDEISYVGSKNTTDNIYSEWFNKIKIPEDKIKNYKIIFIYRNPIDVIFSRFISLTGANSNHLKHIMCNNPNLTLEEVILKNKDLYGIEEFYDNYVFKQNKNYPIYCVKYESFFNNIGLFNQMMEIPNIQR